MLGNCGKIMTPISSTSNQWPQNQILDDQKSFMASSSSANKSMEKTNVVQIDPHQPPLKCPRCDSSNTKFCYYNNYSLSQPRHFCKACKRYWTRGGTLRNVPVGGGCRKNKRTTKRQPSTSGGGGDGISSGGGQTSAANPSRQIDLPPSSSHMINRSLFYNPLEVNFPFSSSFSSARVSSDNTGFDLQPPQMNRFGLGFSSSSGIMSNEGLNSHDYKNGFVKQIQDFSSPFSASGSNNNSIFFGSSSAFASSGSTMASLLASSFQQQKLGHGNTGLRDVEAANNGVHQGLMGFEDSQMSGQNLSGKEVKLEGQNRMGWDPNPNSNQQISSSDDPSSSLLWNTTNGAWLV